MIAFLAAGAALSCLAEVDIELVGQDKFRVQWNGREVVLPSRPELRKIGFLTVCSGRTVTRTWSS